MWFPIRQLLANVFEVIVLGDLFVDDSVQDINMWRSLREVERDCNLHKEWLLALWYRKWHSEVF